MSSNDREHAIRSAAALILASRHMARFPTRKMIEKLAKRAGMPYDEFIAELRDRLYRVGVILKEVVWEESRGKRQYLIPVIDPNIDLEIGWISSIDAAILAIIYVKAVNGKVGIDKIYEDLKKIANFSPEDLHQILDKAIRTLEQRKLIKVNSEERIIEVTPLTLALMPDKKELDNMIIDFLATSEDEVHE